MVPLGPAPHALWKVAISGRLEESPTQRSSSFSLLFQEPLAEAQFVAFTLLSPLLAQLLG